MLPIFLGALTKVNLVTPTEGTYVPLLKNEVCQTNKISFKLKMINKPHY